MMKNHLIALVILFTVIFKANGQDTYSILLRAISLTERDASEETINLISEAIKVNSDYSLLLERAHAFISQGKYNEAIEDLQSANSFRKGSGSYDLARIYAIKGDPSAALENLREHLESEFRIQEKKILLDAAFMRIENTPEWRLFWKTEWYNNFETELSQLEYELSVDNIGEAEIIINRLISGYKGETVLNYPKALIAYSKKDFRSVIDILSTEPVSLMQEKNLRLLARSKYDAGNFIGAATDYSELIKREVPDARLFYLRAGCYRKSGERDKALTDLNRYLELYPEDGDALSMAGKTESETGDNLKALEYFSRNIELHPSVASNYIDRANAFFTSSSWRYAIDDYSMALDLQPDNADVYLNKGISLLNSGKTMDACHDFRQALRLENIKATTYISRYCIE